MTTHEEAQLQARLERYQEALHKIAQAWPCSEAKDMRRVAREALGMRKNWTPMEPGPSDPWNNADCRG
jgi:hypothetical protein